jgi:hypothetical protein
MNHYKLVSDREHEHTFIITVSKLMEMIRNCYKIRIFFDVQIFSGQFIIIT